MPRKPFDFDSDDIRREMEKLLKPILEEQIKLLKKELESAIVDGLQQQLGSVFSSSNRPSSSGGSFNSTRLANSIASIVEDYINPVRTSVTQRESGYSKQVNEAFRESRSQAQAKIQQEGARGSRNL
ncbi:MAG: hypothetical protein MRY32_10050 [Rickettsiales bacterium]|nr:hypothetical protein [Rickettsiales bacterium]